MHCSASACVLVNAPDPALTSTVSLRIPLVTFLVSMDEISSGRLSTVAVMSRIAWIRMSAGANCSVDVIKAHPLSRKAFLKREYVGWES